MALIHIMLGTAQVYLSCGETALARKELSRALAKAQSMRPTRKARILRAYIAMAMERL